MTMIVDQPGPPCTVCGTETVRRVAVNPLMPSLSAPLTTLCPICADHRDDTGAPFPVDDTNDIPF